MFHALNARYGRRQANAQRPGMHRVMFVFVRLIRLHWRCATRFDVVQRQWF